MCVGSLNHLDNCKSFGVFNIFKSMLQIVVFSWYIRKSLPFVSRFTSILMLEDSQLRLLNNIPLLSVYLSQSKKKWWEFSHGAPQLQEAFDIILTLHQS
jgi:hypothetical protein